MTWSDVTVWQWQQINNLLTKKEDLTELDIAVKSLAILTDRTESQIDSLTIKELNEELKEITFISTTEPQPKPVDFIKIGKRKYRCIYDIRQMPYSRYLETKFFGDDVVNNLHRIGASMVRPMKWTWRGYKLDKYDASKHEDYAEDLLSAPFEQVYGSVVFFCQVFSDSIKSLSDFFKKELISQGMSIMEAEMSVEILCNAMDGFIKLPSSQSMKELG
jgi:transcriptional regulator of met regulon